MKSSAVRRCDVEKRSMIYCCEDRLYMSTTAGGSHREKEFRGYNAGSEIRGANEACRVICCRQRSVN